MEIILLNTLGMTDLGSPVLICGDINILHLDGRISTQYAGEFTEQELLARGTGVLCHLAMFVRMDFAPFYSLKYRFISELNWYFDIIEKAGFSYRKCETPIVNYALGGFGHKHFVSNRIDWLRVIYHRFGISVMRESRIVSFLWHNSFHRYPWLGKLHRAMTAPVRLLNK